MKKKQKQKQIKAKKQIIKIQKLLKTASEGKYTGELGSELFIDDASELIHYYKLIYAGKFNSANLKQNDMDTATRDLIDENTFYFIDGIKE